MGNAKASERENGQKSTALTLFFTDFTRIMSIGAADNICKMNYTTGQAQPKLIDWAEFDVPTLVLNISRSIRDYRTREHLPDNCALTSAHAMSFVQKAWRLNGQRANRAELILATCNEQGKGRLILGAFVFGMPDKEAQDGSTCDRFIQSDNVEKGRLFFLAEPAGPAIWNKYVGNYLPSTKPGEANPVRYIEI